MPKKSTASKAKTTVTTATPQGGLKVGDTLKITSVSSPITLSTQQGGHQSLPLTREEQRLNKAKAQREELMEKARTRASSESSLLVARAMEKAVAQGQRLTKKLLKEAEKKGNALIEKATAKNKKAADRVKKQAKTQAKKVK